MTDYNVVWDIDLQAETPTEAAIEAMNAFHDPFSIATVFKVCDTDHPYQPSLLIDAKSGKVLQTLKECPSVEAVVDKETGEVSTDDEVYFSGSLKSYALAGNAEWREFLLVPKHT